MKLVNYEEFCRMPAGTIFAPYEPCILKEELAIKTDAGKEASENYPYRDRYPYFFNGVMPLQPWLGQDTELWNIGDQAPASFEIYDGSNVDYVDYKMFLVFEELDIDRMINALIWAKNGCVGECYCDVESSDEDVSNSLANVVRCKDCNYYHEDVTKKGNVADRGTCDRPFEALVVRCPDEFCSRGTKKVKRIRFHVDDFIDDFNYKNIAFDITGVNKQALESKLKSDYVNHLYELENANYIAVWNCDLQGFETEDDIFFDSDNDRDYKLCKLVNIGEAWFYDVIDENREITYWKRFGE